MEQRRMIKREDEFQEMHIRWVWSELQERFGFNIPEWKKRYTQEFAKQPGNSDELHFFFTFMHKNVNPLLNRILCRPEGYDTFNKFARFVVKQGRK